MLCKRQGVEYSLKLFQSYYQLIPAKAGGRWVGGGHHGVGYFTLWDSGVEIS